ncbi:MAG: hypothetical protein AAGA96_16995 [Verrucomicrobiota bacterium]
MMIRITSSPSGEAPEEVRAAWIGLALPLAYPSRANWKSFGVLSGPKLRIAQWIRISLGHAENVDGYGVDAREAINRLSSYNPEAARWWKENAPSAIREGQYLIFDADACEEIGDQGN